MGYSEFLINAAGSAFIRDTAIYDAKDNLRRREWVAKIKEITHNPVVAYYVYYYKGEEVTTITSNDFKQEVTELVNKLNKYYERNN
jgi:hypothetical protein